MRAVHPSKFFAEVDIRTGLDFIEVFDQDLKKKLQLIHPLNFIKTKITLPVYKVNISYETTNGVYRTSDKYAVMDSVDDDEYIDFWTDMFIRDYSLRNKNHQIKYCQVNSIEKIGEAVLPIG